VKNRKGKIVGFLQTRKLSFSVDKMLLDRYKALQKLFIVRKGIAEKDGVLNFKGLFQFPIDEKNLEISIGRLEIDVCGLFAK
jgi:hypothetical protein